MALDRRTATTPSWGTSCARSPGTHRGSSSSCSPAPDEEAAASGACRACPRAAVPARAAHREVRAGHALPLRHRPVPHDLPRHRGRAEACLPRYLPRGVAPYQRLLDDDPAILVHMLPDAILSHGCLPSRREPAGRHGR